MSINLNDAPEAPPLGFLPKGMIIYGPAEKGATGMLWSFPMIWDGSKWVDILRDQNGRDIFDGISAEIAGGSAPSAMRLGLSAKNSP